MTDQDNFMQGPGGETVAMETLDLMRLHGVPPTADNYEVWLSYRLGRNPQLREAIDQRIASGEAFNAEFSKTIHEKFFTGMGASAQIVLAGERIARDLSQVVSFLKSAEEKSGDYGRTLESAATDLNRGLANKSVRSYRASLLPRSIWPITINI